MTTEAELQIFGAATEILAALVNQVGRLAGTRLFRAWPVGRPGLLTAQAALKYVSQLTQEPGLRAGPDGRPRRRRGRRVRRPDLARQPGHAAGD